MAPFRLGDSLEVHMIFEELAWVELVHKLYQEPGNDTEPDPDAH
jgi:hypothetical protein